MHTCQFSHPGASAYTSECGIFLSASNAISIDCDVERRWEGEGDQADRHDENTGGNGSANDGNTQVTAPVTTAQDTEKITKVTIDAKEPKVNENSSKTDGKITRSYIY